MDTMAHTYNSSYSRERGRRILWTQDLEDSLGNIVRHCLNRLTTKSASQPNQQQTLNPKPWVANAFSIPASHLWVACEQMGSGGWVLLLYACSKRPTFTWGSPQSDHCFSTQFFSVPAGGTTMLEGMKPRYKLLKLPKLKNIERGLRKR